MSSTAWTEGPWVVERNEYLPRVDVVSADAQGTYIAQLAPRMGQGAIDAHLVALAPDMAAAILAWDHNEDLPDDEWDGNIVEIFKNMRKVAEKLRMIGDKG